jgi:hypothetical protein
MTAARIVAIKNVEPGKCPVSSGFDEPDLARVPGLGACGQPPSLRPLLFV